MASGQGRQLDGRRHGVQRVRFPYVLCDTRTLTLTQHPAEPTSTSVEYLPSHPAPTAAAIAVPLSLVAATLLCALLVLLFRGRGARRRDAALRDAEKRACASRDTAVSFASASDIERAVLALAAARGYGAPAPRPHAAALGTGAVGWAHGVPPGPGAFGWAHGVPPVSDAYTPAPAPRGQYARQAPPVLHAEYAQPEPAPRRVDWRETDWRGTARMFAEDPAPQLPAIEIHAGSPPPPPAIEIHAGPPPPPLVPGPHTHRDGDTSLGVISNYLQASPVAPHAPQLAPLALSNYLQASPHALQLAPPAGVEGEKPLPSRPDERVGTDLYGAVSRAVGG